MKNVAIIIPAYNEGSNISGLVEKIRFEIGDCEIFIIDDSRNNESELVLKSNKRNKYFHRGKKLGRGSAAIYGLKEALKLSEIEIFIEMDADFSHNPNELKSKINYFFKENLDLLVASRYTKKSRIVNWSKSRSIFSKLSNFLAKKLLKIPVSDYTNGYRFYSRRSVEKIVSKCGKIGDGFIVLSEILVVIDSNNFKIGEKETIFVNRVRGESSVNIKLIIQSLIGLLKLYFLKKKNHGT